MNTILRIRDTAKRKGIKLSYICEQLGLKSRTYFNDLEKNNREIPHDKLEIIAQCLDVSTSYLKGESDEPKKPAVKGELTEHEQNIINAYRLQPHLQEAVDRVLGIKDLKILGTERDGKVILFKAAASQNHHDTEIIEMDAEQWKKIKESPNTDDSLL